MQLRGMLNTELLVIGLLSIPSVTLGNVIVEQNGGTTTIRFEGGPPFRTTTDMVTDATGIVIPDTSIQIATWNEHSGATVFPYYAIAPDGVNAARVRRTSYQIGLRYGAFDPLVSIPPVDPVLEADAATNLYVVQFVTQPIGEFSDAITTLGGTVRHFLANHARIVEMSDTVRLAVAQLPYVRWVGPYHPAYRLQQSVRTGLRAYPRNIPDA